MNIDLLETRLNALEEAEVSGLIDYKTRQTVVCHLQQHINEVGAMQFLVDATPDGLLYAVEIGYTDDAPELHIQMKEGTLDVWRAFLGSRGFKELGTSSAGIGFSGPCVVRLTKRRIHLHQTLPAQEVAA